MVEFSFIIPMYNCEHYIKKSIENILNMKRSDYEILLIDDGSKDNTSIVCNKMVQKSRYISYFYQKNSGVSSARNRGLSYAKGKYVIFIDADDTFDFTRMNQLLNIVKDNYQLDLVVFGISFDYYYRNKLYRRDEIRPPLTGVREREEWIPKLNDLYSNNSLNPVWNKIIKRELLLKNKVYFKENMFLYEDLEFSLRCMAYCNLVLFQPSIIYHYCQSEEEGNIEKRLKRIEHISVVITQIENALKKCVGVPVNQEKENNVKEILLKLYLVLAREKISISNRQEISRVCREFSTWYYTNVYMKSEDIFISRLLNHKVRILYIKSIYSKYRHKIAVMIKNTFLYQKWRGVL